MKSAENIKFEVIKKLSQFRSRFKELGKVSRIDTISPPSVFVGSKLRYPTVNVGIMSPLERDENAWVYDAEKYWTQENYGIADVVRLRDSLLNSRFRANVKDVRNSGKFVQIAQEIAIASKPVDVEIELKKALITNYNKSLPFSQEMTGSAEIITEDMRLLERLIGPVYALIKEKFTD